MRGHIINGVSCRDYSSWPLNLTLALTVTPTHCFDITSSRCYCVQAEDRQAQEVRKLKRELEMAQDKITTLTTQLSTNVSSFPLLIYPQCTHTQTCCVHLPRLAASAACVLFQAVREDIRFDNVSVNLYSIALSHAQCF